MILTIPWNLLVNRSYTIVSAGVVLAATFLLGENSVDLLCHFLRLMCAMLGIGIGQWHLTLSSRSHVDLHQ